MVYSVHSGSLCGFPFLVSHDNEKRRHAAVWFSDDCCVLFGRLLCGVRKF